MKKILFILLLLPYFGFSQQGRKAGRKTTYGIVQFWDSTYFQNVQYNSGAGIVHLGIDTVTGSPTFGKLVRKTAGGVSTMAAIGGTPNANGASISGSTLTLQPADGSFGGVVTTGTQTFGGNKTFNGTIVMSGAGGPRLEVSTSSTGFGNRAGRFVRFPATSTGVETALTVERQNNSGNGADGIGVSIDFYNEAADGNQLESSRLISLSRNATSRNTQFSITNAINGNTDTSITVGDYVTLTESSATTFTSTAIGNSKIQGGQIIVTVEANDATDFQSRTLRFIWSAVNKAGTLTITISTPEEVVAVSAGTLTVAITAVDAGSAVLQFKANAVSSLTQSTLRATYQTFKNF